MPMTESTDDRPNTIELDRRSHLLLGWPDGTSARFDISSLRLACPCAGCRSRHEQGLRSVPDDGQAVEAVNANVVGSYALGIEWRDGRCNSIYSFATLRSWAEQMQTRDAVPDS